MIARLNRHYETSSVQQVSNFTSLDRGIQAMVKQMFQGETKFTVLLANESNATRSHITNEATVFKDANHADSETIRSGAADGIKNTIDHQSTVGATIQSVITNESTDLAHSQRLEAEHTRSHLTDERARIKVETDSRRWHDRVLSSLFSPTSMFAKSASKDVHRKTFE